MDRERAFMRSKMQKSEYCSIGSVHCLILRGWTSLAGPQSACARTANHSSRVRPLNLAGDEQGLLVLVGWLLQADWKAVVVVRQHRRHIPAWICMRVEGAICEGASEQGRERARARRRARVSERRKWVGAVRCGAVRWGAAGSGVVPCEMMACAAARMDCVDR